MLEKKINDLLFLAAAPFNNQRLETLDYIAIEKELKNKFNEGYSFLEEFRKDCISVYANNERFTHTKIDNMFQLLEIMLNIRDYQFQAQDKPS